MRNSRRMLVSAGTALALAMTATPAAMANDGTVLEDNTNPHRITVFPQGSSIIGPVNITINNAIIDADDLTVILDTVARCPTSPDRSANSTARSSNFGRHEGKALWAFPFSVLKYRWSRSPADHTLPGCIAEGASLQAW